MVENRDYLKAGIIYILLICVVYSPIVFWGRTLSMSARYPWFKNLAFDSEKVLPDKFPNMFNVDIATPSAFEETIDAFIGNQLRRYKFPLWNPFIACGTVMLEQFSTRLLFPYQLLQNVCPWRWRDFFLLGRLFFAAMGVFIFLRMLKVSFYPSLCGGIMYGFSGAMTVFLTLTQMSNVGMMLPYGLAASEILYRNQNIRSIFLFSLIIALLILGGQPEVCLYGILLISSYYFFRLVSVKDVKVFTTRTIICYFISIIFGLLLSSPSFIPFLSNYSQYYHLHPFGGTQGIETPTPVPNFMAIFLPELLRWRSMLYAVTVNAGWDCLGGYVGIASTFLIIAVITKKHWEGRKEYLFFLCWAIFILLKNMNVPMASWIGKLPVFDQIWTPRWAGPVWNLSWVLSASFAFEALLSTSTVLNNNYNNKLLEVRLSKLWLRMTVGILIFIFGLLITNPVSVMLTKFLPHTVRFSSGAIVISRIIFILISGLMVYKPVSSLKFSSLFFVFFIGIALCVLNFQTQFPHIEGEFKDILLINDKLVLVSMWQGIMETTILGVVIALVLSFVLKNRAIDKNKFALTISGIILIEMSFHVTIGYDELGRLVNFLLHFIILVGLMLYSLFLKVVLNTAKITMGICLFTGSMFAIGVMGRNCMPERKNIFPDSFYNLNHCGFLRITGIRGLLFPNISSVFEARDIKSVVSISLKRYQLFQDNCFLIEPQEKYHSLWFTGIINCDGKNTISESLKLRSPFYALAGVSNYLSPYYEDIPHTELIQDGKIKNYKNLAVLPRAFMVYKWSLVNTPEDALQWLLSHSLYLDSEAVIEGSHILINSGLLDLQEKPFSEVEVKSHDLHLVEINVETDKPGVLILTDTYYPDWKVKVNGKNTSVFPTDLCFRGVFLSQGKHKIEFKYVPKFFYICSILSLITFSLLCILSLLKRNLLRVK